MLTVLTYLPHHHPINMELNPTDYRLLRLALGELLKNTIDERDEVLNAAVFSEQRAAESEAAVNDVRSLLMKVGASK